MMGLLASFWPMQTMAEHNLPVLAKISAMAQHAQEPEWFSTAPAFAIQKTLPRRAYLQVIDSTR